MSFSSEIEQATCGAFAAMLLAQQMQQDALLQSMQASQSPMSYFSCDCEDDEEPSPSTNWLSSIGSSINTMWSSLLMSSAMDRLLGLIGRLKQAGQQQQKSPAAPQPTGGWPSSSPGPGWSGFHSPLDKGTITSAFGPRIDPVGHRKCGFHHGVDIGAPSGTPIRAAAAGRVVAAGWVAGYGNYIRIDHGNGRETAYGHCSELDVYAGQQVKGGEVIGKVGSTGHSTGPHLHFEVITKGKRENPCNHVHL